MFGNGAEVLTCAGLEAGAVSKGFRYERHRPERALLYQLVEQYYPELADLMAAQGKPLPGYVRREFGMFGLIGGKDQMLFL